MRFNKFTQVVILLLVAPLLALIGLLFLGHFQALQIHSLLDPKLDLKHFILLPLMGIVAGGRFQDFPCNVVIGNNFDTHGTITRASTGQLTPAALEALFKPGGKYSDMDEWFRTQLEMKACGTKLNGLFDWLMSSQKNVRSLVSVQPVERGPGLLRPFILGKQDSVINNDYWVISGGAANSAYTGDLPATAIGTTTAGPLTAADKALGAAGDRVIRVITRYGFDMDPKFFVSRDRIHIFGLSGGQSQRGQWKVLASEVSTDLTYIDVLITSENGGSATPFATAPTAGVIIVGTNNVNDFESFCANRPTQDPRKRVPFWYKTDRWGRQIDSEYKVVFARLMESNEFFRNFGDLPLAERNRQDEELRQRRWVHDFFYSKKISANQTLANWQSLETISTRTGTTIDAGLGGQLQAYRANPVGIIEQLKACGREMDLQNNLLNFYEFLDENYRIMRARKSQGRVVDTLDWYTDQVYAANIETAFVNYLKREYGDIVRINIETGTNELGFSWRIFKPKFPSISIAIVTHEFFDDQVNAFDNESLAVAGRVLWCLDMGAPGQKGGTIYPGVIGRNQKMRTIGNIEDLGRLTQDWACTLENVTEEIRLQSETWTAICECPANSLAIKGIADGVPTTTGRNPVPGGYTDLY